MIKTMQTSFLPAQHVSRETGLLGLESVKSMISYRICTVTWRKWGIIYSKWQTIINSFALTIKPKWAIMTFRGLCSTVLLQFSTKYSGNLCQFSILWEWFSRMCTNSRTLAGEGCADTILLLLFQSLPLLQGPCLQKVKLVAILPYKR